MTKEELEEKYHTTLEEFVEKYKEYQEKTHYWKKEFNHLCRVKNEEIDELNYRLHNSKQSFDKLKGYIFHCWKIGGVNPDSQELETQIGEYRNVLNYLRKEYKRT